MRLSLILTHQCDLACSYCYAGEKSARDLPREVGERALERAFATLATGEALHLGFFGGEPLLAWEQLVPLARRARAMAAARRVELDLHLTTNGTHLSEAVLAEGLALGIRFTVSMDGLPEVHDRFRPRRGGQPSSAAALAAIARLVAAGAPFSVVSVVRPETVGRLGAGARFLAERGVRSLIPSLDAHAQWAPEHGAALERAIGELRALYVERFPALGVSWLETALAVLEGAARPACGVGEGEVAVAPSGRLYPCEQLVGADDEQAQRFARGHVADSGPLRAPLAPRAQPDQCSGCASEGACANSCACFNLARTGDPARPDGLRCTLERAALREARRARRELLAPAARRARRRARRLPQVEVCGG